MLAGSPRPWGERGCGGEFPFTLPVSTPPDPFMPTYLVTGGTGFVGSHVVEEAIRRGHTVRCLARPNSDTAFLKSIGCGAAQCYLISRPVAEADLPALFARKAEQTLAA